MGCALAAGLVQYCSSTEKERKTMDKNMICAICLIGILLFLGGCAAGPNPLVNKAADNGKIAGFWRGLWHGIIAPFTFIISLFRSSVHMYEVHNNGGWYNFGFGIGAGFLYIGGSSFYSRRKRTS